MRRVGLCPREWIRATYGRWLVGYLTVHLLFTLFGWHTPGLMCDASGRPKPVQLLDFGPGP